MMRIVNAVIALASTLVLSACATQYQLRYEAQLRNASGEGGLSSQQDGLSFEFLPLPTGVAFAVSNKSAEDVVLDWSRSYFIEPGGNSFKALNSDTLKEDSKVAMKSLDVVTVPSGAMLRRFTTASVNPEGYNIVRSQTLSAWMGTAMGNWTYSSFGISEGYKFPGYFPLEFSAEASQLERKLKEVADVMRRGSSMGVGLMIRSGSTEKLYRFDIDYTKVGAVVRRQVEVQPGVFEMQLELTHESQRASNWEWVDLRPKAAAKPPTQAP
jgi:hypothetical protein